MIRALLRLAVLIWAAGVMLAVVRDGHPFVDAAGSLSMVLEALTSTPSR